MVSDSIHDYLATIGRKGGSAGRGPAKARTSEQARRAAMVRWEKRATVPPARPASGSRATPGRRA
jgi:hypothetical protein